MKEKSKKIVLVLTLILLVALVPSLVACDEDDSLTMMSVASAGIKAGFPFLDNAVIGYCDNGSISEALCDLWEEDKDAAERILTDTVPVLIGELMRVMSEEDRENFISQWQIETRTITASSRPTVQSHP